MSAGVRFAVDGDDVVGRHFVGEGDSFVSPAGRPCVVMAHGFGGTRDSGLDEFAGALAAGGLDVLAFDYRHFGESAGNPRQLLSVRRQLEDFAAAVAFARTLPGVDPDRIVVWGTSFSGGHVLRLAAQDPGVAAVIALTPSTDGLASVAHKLRVNGPARTLSLTGLGVLDAARHVTRKSPLLARVTGPERDRAAALSAPEIRCPVLVQIADDDRTAPPRAAEKAAEAARAEVRHYPCDHIDVYAGRPWFEPVVEHQLFFLRRHLASR